MTKHLLSQIIVCSVVLVLATIDNYAATAGGTVVWFFGVDIIERLIK